MKLHDLSVVYYINKNRLVFAASQYLNMCNRNDHELV